MNVNQKKKLINGASSLLKSLVKGAAKKQTNNRGSVAPSAPTAPAKAPCGACGGSK